jgi:Ubiquitin-activating enzyme E1 FCCH domain
MSSLSTYVPFYSVITAVTKAPQAVVTFSANHSFTVGEIVSFRVSKASGMVELNNQEALVVALTPTTITVPINSTNYTTYVNRGLYIQNPAVCVPSSSGVVPGAIPAQTNLEDAFDNVPTN